MKTILKGLMPKGGLRRSVFGIVAAVPAALFASTADAAPIETALSVVIDGSGSIGTTDFQTQIDAYAAVLGDSSILAADGSVVINVVQFSTEGSGIVEQTALRIDTEADRTTLLNSINAMSQIDGLTDIQEGINLGVTDMDAFLGGIGAGEFASNFTKLVDVSTDGFHNEGGSPATEAQNAVNNLGYAAVNCLGIGSGADCSWNDGVGSDFSASTFADVERVLVQKIGTELGTIPEPATAALFGASLLGLGVMRRRRQAA